MKPSIVYVDESGNEGDVAGHPAPFAAQATFALAGVVEEDGSDAAEELVRELRSAYKFQAEDLKWKSFARKPTALVQLVRGLPRVGLVPFVELMDKRHYVASNIVTYVLGNRRLDYANAELRTIANDFANVLASEIGDDVLMAYALLSKDPTRERFETFLLMLRAGIHEAMDEMVLRRSPKRLALLVFMDEVLDEVVGAWHAAGALDDVRRFVQDPDETVGGHRLGLLPQVQALANLCARLNKYLCDRSEVRLVHDEQNEFGALIEHYLSLLTSNEYARLLDSQTVHAQAPVSWNFPPGKFRLSFGDSKRTAGVQIADVLAGFCRSRLDTVAAEGRPDERFDIAAGELAKIAPPAGVLFVTTEQRIARFLGGPPQ